MSRRVSPQPTTGKVRENQERWRAHQKEWRHPAQAASVWAGADDVHRKLLASQTRGDWWGLLASLGIVLVVTREYEHLVLGLRPPRAGSPPSLTYFVLPHPSGVVADQANAVVYVASTRNPSQVYEFGPPAVLFPSPGSRAKERAPLMPLRSRFFPGRLYLHDLALIDGRLHANAVGENTVISLPPEGGYVREWWPASIDARDGGAFEMNYLQLNSIAAGRTLQTSFFSASTDKPARQRPGHLNFPVDRRGVIFSGASREPIVHGLTRPHSARLHAGKLWVNNSGYGEFGSVDEGRFHAHARLRGWTRGLAFYDDFAFVGTSRVIPRFAHYAPGVDDVHSECGVHALNWRTGELVASILFPNGNQVFGIDWLLAESCSGFPFRAGAKRQLSRDTVNLFYTYCVS